MSIVAVQERPGTSPTSADRTTSNPDGTSFTTGAADPPDPAELATRLRESIDHHRAESRRLARAAEQHRAKLNRLLAQRDKHAIELHGSGWALQSIAGIYRLSRERIRQIVAATTASSRASDGAPTVGGSEAVA